MVEHGDVRSVLTRNEDLEIYIETMRQFNQAFCDGMGRGRDFTIKIEVHGNDGRMIHCRVSDDSFARTHRGK